LGAEGKANALAQRIFAAKISLNECATCDHDSGGVFGVGCGEEATFDKRDFQRMEIAGANGQDLAFIFLPRRHRATFLDKADGAASSASWDSRSLPDVHDPGHRAQALGELMVEANGGGTVVRRSLVAGIGGIRQVHRETQNIVKVEARIAANNSRKASQKDPGTDS